LKPGRLISPPGTYFVAFSTHHRRKRFVLETYVHLFLHAVYRYRREGRYELHAFVVTPEHVHLLLTPARDVTIERSIQLIKGAYSHELGTIIGRDQESGSAASPITGFGMPSILCITKITFIAIPWSGTLCPIPATIAIAPGFPDSSWILGPQRLKPRIYGHLDGTSRTRALPVRAPLET
jgi:REP element-mobilizing transposase RayT